MRAVHVKAPGGTEMIELVDIPSLSPASNEVLIDVAAAGVNRADILQRQGHYPPPAGASPILGMEVSGTISALGDGVSGFAVGDRICALLAGGGYAEQAVVDAGQIIPVPANMDLIEAASLPEALCTVYYNLILQAQLKEGELLLVHGGGSGIGTAAIQLAKAMGMRVACTAGSKEKLDAVRSIGADIAINYREKDFVARVREEGGADVILDIMGASYLPRNVDALRANGRLVVIGLQGGRKGELDLAKLLSKQGKIIATTLRGLPLARKNEIVAGVRRDFWPLVENGAYRPVIDRILPLADAAEAHRLIEASAVTGKLVLKII